LSVGVIVAVVFAGLVVSRSAEAQDFDIEGLLGGMALRYAEVAQYTATFLRQERIGGTLRKREVIQLKFRKPNSIYMRWVEGNGAGREVIVVEGRDFGRALIHEPDAKGIFTIVIAPDHPRVLQESRFPISDVGLGRLIDLARAGARTGATVSQQQRGTSVRIAFTNSKPVTLCGCQKAIVTVDSGLKLPLGAEIFDERGELLGSYLYSHLNLAAPLGDADFDSRNPEYGFSILRWRY